MSKTYGPSGFVYIWRDRKHKRYYIGSHWGSIDDDYVCSSNKMRNAYRRRPEDFKRRVIAVINTNRHDLFMEEQRWLYMIPEHQFGNRYYNLHQMVHHWITYPDKVKTIAQKISATKTGVKTGPRSPEIGRAISKAKRRKFQERREQGLSCYSVERTFDGNKGNHQTEEWKQQNSIRLKKQWDNGIRKRAEPKQTMSREEQDILCSKQLKSRWNDPVWRANQIARLKEGSKRRYS